VKRICGIGWGSTGTCPKSPTKAHSCGKEVIIPDSVDKLPDNSNKLKMIALICNKHKCGYCKDQKKA